MQGYIAVETKHMVVVINTIKIKNEKLFGLRVRVFNIH